jgi:hypothetical protein
MAQKRGLRDAILSELLRRPNMLDQDNIQQQQQRLLVLEEDCFWCEDMSHRVRRQNEVFKCELFNP